MKNSAKAISLTLAAALAIPLTACAAAPDFGSNAPAPGGIISDAFDLPENYVHESVIEQPFVSAAEKPDSYFSLDRNTASYSYMRRIINDGHKVDKGSVRLEEYINYFSYDYARPENGDALAVGGKLFDCPWNVEHKLMTVEIAAEETKFSDTRNNVVFLIDTSGSMYGDDRLGLIQQAFTMLTETLNADDTVSIVTYAGDSRVALDGEKGANKTRIANVLQDLTANGSTNGAGGIHKAYALAEKYYDGDANNRVIIATDGDFNVGASSKKELNNLISEKRDSGVYLSVLGVGMRNTNDVTMKTLAENGNGNYAYLDSVTEARKVLVNELGGTFNTVAKDAKIGVEFSADTVDKYRLIGYESKILTQEEFEDEQKDAGEIGSGHTVTALYELELKSGASGNVASAEVRYKAPATDESASVAYSVTTDDYMRYPNEDCVFIGCVTEYGLLLRKSVYGGNASFAAVVARLSALDCTDAESGDPFKAEFLQIVKAAEKLYAKPL